MKSIKNQYIALKEGKMTEAQFLRNVKMTLPQYISNVTLFKQAERILLNKGIISEVKSEEIETVQDEKGNFTRRVKLSDKDKKTVEKVQALMAKEKSLKEDQDKKYQISKAGSKSNPHYVLEKPDGSKQIDMMFDTPEDAKKYASKKELSIIKEAKDTSATGYYNQDGKEQYGKFDELDNMNAQEIMAGYVMEKQDNPNIDKKEAVKLVIKNLKKDQFYYTNYKLTGVRDLQPTEFTTTKLKPGFDDMEEINKNGDNFVDEKNKMVVIKEGLEEAKEYSPELSVENIRNIIKDTNRFYREDKTSIDKSSEDESIRVFMNGNRIIGETRTILEKLFDVQEESEEIDTDRLPLYTYFITPKSTPDQDIPQKDDFSDEDIFENKDVVKAKLKEMIRKMMKEMFDGRDNLTDVE